MTHTPFNNILLHIHTSWTFHTPPRSKHSPPLSASAPLHSSSWQLSRFDQRPVKRSCWGEEEEVEEEVLHIHSSHSTFPSWSREARSSWRFSFTASRARGHWGLWLSSSVWARILTQSLIVTLRRNVDIYGSQWCNSRHQAKTERADCHEIENFEDFIIARW